MSNRQQVEQKLQKYLAALGRGDMKSSGRLVAEMVHDLLAMIAPVNGIDHALFPEEETAKPEVVESLKDATDFYRGTAFDPAEFYGDKTPPNAVPPCKPCDPTNDKGIFRDRVNDPVVAALLDETIGDTATGFTTVRRPASMKVIKRTKLEETIEKPKGKPGRKPKDLTARGGLSKQGVNDAVSKIKERPAPPAPLKPRAKPGRKPKA
jgi:hypothetical protein